MSSPWGDGAPGDESAGRAPFGGQRPADSHTGAPSQEEPTGETLREGAEAEGEEEQAGASEEAGAGAEQAVFDSPAEPASPEAGSVPETDDPVARERDEYKAALQRLQADFENYKKRVTKQAEETRERAAESLVEKLLPVLDTADLALSHGGSEDTKQIAAGLYAALEKEGLERIDNAGELFDPTRHDAVAHEPGDGASEVAEVFRAGFRWRGRVLRPAMVKVRG